MLTIHTGQPCTRRLWRQGGFFSSKSLAVCRRAKVGPVLLHLSLVHFYWQDPLEVPTDLECEPEEEVDVMQGAERNLVDYMGALLDVFPEHFASRLEKLFLEPARGNCQLRVGTLCSGSDSVVDVLKAGLVIVLDCHETVLVVFKNF